jgi:hypothetical protein
MEKIKKDLKKSEGIYNQLRKAMYKERQTLLKIKSELQMMLLHSSDEKTRDEIKLLLENMIIV